jgi:site-specific DNA recombinase
LRPFCNFETPPACATNTTPTTSRAHFAAAATDHCCPSPTAPGAPNATTTSTASKKRDAGQPFTPVPVAERAVEDLFDTIVLPTADANRLRQELDAAIPILREREHEERLRLQKRRARLEKERGKLLQAHYDDAIPLNLLKKEQQRISREVMEIDYRLSTLPDALDIAHQ